MPTQLNNVVGVPLVSQVLMSRDTGKEVYEVQHLKLCILDILTTPIGSRVMRRQYGSNIFYLIDRPINRSTILSIYAATARALNRWEPRFIMSSVSLDASNVADGQLTLSIEGWYLIQSKLIRLDNLTLDFYKDSRYSKGLV